MSWNMARKMKKCKMRNEHCRTQNMARNNKIRGK